MRNEAIVAMIFELIEAIDYDYYKELYEAYLVGEAEEEIEDLVSIVRKYVGQK